jgi:crotonobetainyl-CoA:carnitine CoA-transferase CaiB-like acyl-CoA transferase
MIGRPEWAEDPTLTRLAARMGRYAEICSVVDEWTSVRSTSEIVDMAVLFRLPVAPVAHGKTIQEFEQTVARGWYLRHPDGFIHPDVPYTFHGKVRRRAFGGAPRLGRDTDSAPTWSMSSRRYDPTAIVPRRSNTT